MGLFDKITQKKANKNDGANELLNKHELGELDDISFLQSFKNTKVFYSTPFGDHKDGSKKIFLLPGPNETGYQPVFSSKERMAEFYEKVGRVAYMIIEGTFVSVLETTKKTNEGGSPVKMGLVIDPGNYNVTVDSTVLDNVIEMIK